MANENASRDQNYVTVLTAVTDDAAQEIRMIRVDPVTNRILASITGAGAGTVTSIEGGTGILADPDPITDTGTVSLATELQPMATLTGNSLKVLRVNVGETAVEYATIGSGTVTEVSSANGALSVATGTTTPVLTVNSAPVLTTARTIGGVSFDGSANITVATATGGFTVSGGALALGANNLTMTGSLAETGARVTKGWFTDIESTNMPTVGGTALSSTFAPIASPTFTGLVTTPAIKITTGAAAGKVLTSDADGDATWEDVSGGGSTISTIPAPMIPPDTSNADPTVGLSMANNTTGYVGVIQIPVGITINKVTQRWTATQASANVKFGIYELDGQTQVFNVTVPSDNALETVTLGSPVQVSAGNYYLVMVSDQAVPSHQPTAWATSASSSALDALINTVTGEPKYEGTITVVASTLPATFDPNADVTGSLSKTGVVRFDN